MEFRILGPVDVVDSGTPIALGSAKERCLLARLLISANEVVPLDRLVDDLWECEGSDQASGNLRVYVSRLRKSLRAAGRNIVDPKITRLNRTLVRQQQAISRR